MNVDAYRSGQTFGDRTVCGCRLRRSCDPAKPCYSSRLAGGCPVKEGERCPCSQHPTPGRKRCKKHGGASLRGIAHPSTKSAITSIALPKHLRERFAQLMEDPTLLSLRSEMSTLVIRASQILESMDRGESEVLWDGVNAAWATYEAARGKADKLALAKALLAVGDAIEAANEERDKASATRDAWAEYRKIAEQIRKLSATEGRHLVDQHQMITSQQALTFAYAVLESVRRHVPDRNARAAVAADIHQALNVGSDDRNGGGAGR